MGHFASPRESVVRYGLDAALLALATARLTRLITTDTITQWTLRDPLRRRATSSEQRHRARLHARLSARLDALPPGSPALRETADRLHEVEASDDPLSPAARAYSGLECPFCIGFWVSAAAVAAYLLARRSPRALAALRAVAAPLALNYVTAHLSARAD